MTDDGGARVSSAEPIASKDASQTRRRKKRKWDQPADSFVSSGVALPGFLGTVPIPGVIPTSALNPLEAPAAGGMPLHQAHHVPLVSPKTIQPKIQDELIIAREIVINAAETSVRYKLTKRQTQEEIQRCTGAVVITRGKYRPPNAPQDGEKPLYLHISAGAHLKETAERILAVDRAAAMVEEMLKHGSNVSTPLGSQPGNIAKPFSTCVYLGFVADPSLSIAARIRGPNDQYINHIMNETGATVVLRGQGSGNLEGPHGEELKQPLHLFLSSYNPKSLEDAKRLAENLLDTISMEFGSSRISSSKVYGAVPPPQQLLTEAQGSDNEHKSNAGIALSVTGGEMAYPIASVSVSIAPAAGFWGKGLVSTGIVNCSPLPTAVSCSLPFSTRGTSYSGYGGIYPQVTPLQQVALVLKHSTSPVISTVNPTVSAASTTILSASSSQEKKQPIQKRKFQELPVGFKSSAKIDQCFQDPDVPRMVESGSDVIMNTVTLPAQNMLQPSSNHMPPPPPKFMPPAPLPERKSSSTPSKDTAPPVPKFFPPQPSSRSQEIDSVLHTNKLDKFPDTLVKLMEYGDDDDDDDL